LQVRGNKKSLQICQQLIWNWTTGSWFFVAKKPMHQQLTLKFVKKCEHAYVNEVIVQYTTSWQIFLRNSGHSGRLSFIFKKEGRDHKVQKMRLNHNLT
jgi:hypothetical protein